jgi:hypothetical protein
MFSMQDKIMTRLESLEARGVAPSATAGASTPALSGGTTAGPLRSTGGSVLTSIMEELPPPGTWPAQTRVGVSGKGASLEAGGGRGGVGEASELLAELVRTQTLVANLLSGQGNSSASC